MNPTIKFDRATTPDMERKGRRCNCWEYTHALAASTNTENRRSAMKRPTTLFATLLVTLLSLSLSFTLTSISTARAASIFASLPNGYAFAGNVEVPGGSTSAGSGPVAPAWLGCTLASRSVSNTVAAMSLGSYGNAGNTQTSVTNQQTATSGTIQTLATLQNVNILSGLITATKIRAGVSSTTTSAGATSSILDATFTGLNVAGHAISASPGPNTTIHIANLGDVVLNEQGRGPSNGPVSTYAGINMIDLHVTNANTLGLPIGTHILIATVNSSEQLTPEPAIVGGQAYALNTTGNSNSGPGSGSTSSGPVAAAIIGCAGGTTQTNIASTSQTNIGNTGQVNDTASGQITSSGTTATSQANVMNMNLLKGLIQGSQVVAKAQAKWNGTGSGSASTTLTNVMVAGVPVANYPAPNTRIPILGLGYVILNEQSSNVSSSAASESVNGIHVYVTQSNAFGLSVGAQIIIGHADARVTSFS